jgi:hypothetical protein
MAAPMKEGAWLEWMTGLMGGGSRQTYAATLPPDRFYCLLDDLPLHLIPRPAAHRLRRVDWRQRLIVNPECVLLPAGQAPEAHFAQEWTAGFAKQGTVAWVPDAEKGMALPFWLGPRLEAVVRGLMQGGISAMELEAEDRALLAAARIVVASEASRPGEESKQRWSDYFREHGYAPMAGLIHPFHIAAMRRYYRFLIRTGKIQLGDGQSPRRYVAYNDPVARFFHRQITGALSGMAGEPLKPSYVYMASYLSGAELRKHTDREQCEFSVTLCLDFSPEPELATPWPIRLDTASGTVKVYQALGDGLAYRGTRLPHYRSRLGEGQTSTSIFFHYVPEDFLGSLD